MFTFYRVVKVTINYLVELDQIVSIYLHVESFKLYLGGGESVHTSFSFVSVISCTAYLQSSI